MVSVRLFFSARGCMRNNDESGKKQNRKFINCYLISYEKI